MTKVAILGAGNVGLALSGYFGMQGFKVSLFEFPHLKENLEAIRAQKGVEVTGSIEGFGKIDLITTDIQAAIENAEVIIVAVPAYVHKDIALAIAKHLTDEQVVVLNSGSVFGSLVFANTLKSVGNENDVTIVESSNMAGCRKVAPGKVRVMGIAKSLTIAAYPKKRTEIAIS